MCVCVYCETLLSNPGPGCCCLFSVVVLGAAIVATDYVLPGHADKVDNLVVVVVRLQLLGRNKPQINLLDLLPDWLLTLLWLRRHVLLRLPLRLWLVLEVGWFRRYAHRHRRHHHRGLVVETSDAIRRFLLLVLLPLYYTKLTARSLPLSLLFYSPYLTLTTAACVCVFEAARSTDTQKL